MDKDLEDVPPGEFVEEMFDIELIELSIVDNPATGKPLQLFKRMAKATKATPEGRDTAGGAGKGAQMGTKEDPVTDMGSVNGGNLDATPDVPSMSVAEIPASPARWGFDQCIRSAMDMGLDQDQSVAVCTMIRQDYGDPTDPESILVPDGVKPDGLLAAAAVAGGMAKPSGTDVGASSDAGKAIKFTGVNHWKQWLQRLLKPRPVTVDANKAVARLEGTMEKTREDLRAMLRAQQAVNQQLLGMIARGQGIELPPMPTVDELYGTSAPVSEPAATVTMAEPAVAAPAAIAEPGAKSADPRNMSRDELLEMVLGAAERQPAGAGALLAAAPSDHDSELIATDIHPGIDEATRVVLGDLMGDLPPAPTPAKTWRAAVDPSTDGNGNGQAKVAADVELTYSTVLGCYIPKADRDACTAIVRPGREGKR